ncbi:MAG: pyruvate dehydrogenase E2 component (dihydrolipoamide acetyltransferase) [Gammaproteobacteria bacterium]|jgi:pyruvate dehydrogenase E2 component (dihydrolipoamide acetyltransferase)
MTKEIHVPDIGDFDSVDVIEVLVNVGDTIAIDDALITLESDKASMDIPAPEGGIVKEIKVAAGDSVTKGSLILLMEDSNEASDPAKPMTHLASDKEPTPGDAGERSLETIKVPDIGDFETVDVIEVLVKVGDKVSIDDPLVTLESDKASMDIPSPASGIVKELKIAVGDQVSQGSRILILEGHASPLTAASTKVTEPAAAASSNRAPQVPAAGSMKDADSFRRAHASPSVRRIAREMNIDLTKISGTGRNGRITEHDVHTFSNSGGESVSVKTSPAAGSEMGIPIITQPDWSKFGDIELIAMSRIGKLSAKHLHRAWLNVPQVTHFDEADITELEAYRQDKKGIAKTQGFSLTPLVFVMKAIAAGLKQFPKFNSAMDDAGENLIQRNFYNIGIAVDTPDGLVVPVIREVDRKSLFELAAELGEVSKRARDGQLKAADMQGGCFSISSLGGIGGTNFTPIVNAPEVGILGITRAQARLVRKNGEIVDRLIQPLAVSYDHRVIDGAYAARFVGHIAYLLSDLRNLLL